MSEFSLNRNQFLALEWLKAQDNTDLSAAEFVKKYEQALEEIKEYYVQSGKTHRAD